MATTIPQQRWFIDRRNRVGKNDITMTNDAGVRMVLFVDIGEEGYEHFVMANTLSSKGLWATYD